MSTHATFLLGDCLSSSVERFTQHTDRVPRSSQTPQEMEEDLV